MNRRGFLAGLAAAIVSPAIVKAEILMPIKPLIHTIYGDGFHCDADGINAFLRGERVRNLAGVQMMGGAVWFPPKTFLLTTTLVLPPRSHIKGEGMQTKLIHSGSGPALECSEYNIIEKFYIEGPSDAWPAIVS